MNETLKVVALLITVWFITACGAQGSFRAGSNPNIAGFAEPAQEQKPDKDSGAEMAFQAQQAQIQALQNQLAQMNEEQARQEERAFQVSLSREQSAATLRNWLAVVAAVIIGAVVISYLYFRMKENHEVAMDRRLLGAGRPHVIANYRPDRRLADKLELLNQAERQRGTGVEWFIQNGQLVNEEIVEKASY